MIRPSLLAAIVGLCCLAEAAAAEVTRFVRFADGAGAHYGVLEDNRVHQLSGTPFGPHERTGQSHALSAVRLLPPVVPGKVIAVGLNYRSHAGMSGGARPELFAKLPSAVIGPGQAIVIPPDARNVHYEGELVAIIGRRARDIQPADAARYILGVTAGNDVSERSWQASDLQWLRAKASDTFAPMGPVLAVGLDFRDLQLITRVNGQVRQDESTRNLIHGVADIVAYISRYITLMPGDAIYTGTPGRTRALAPGDVVEVEIEGIGILRNPVRAE